MEPNIQEIYDRYMKFTDDMVGEYQSILEIAAVMMAQALSIYKTTMDEEDFNRMVDNISSARDKVQKFERPNLQ
jgi:hemerythrin-like domain-containing protein